MQLYDDLKTEIDANHSLNPTVIDGYLQNTAIAEYVLLIYEGRFDSPKAGIGLSPGHLRNWPFVIECQAKTEALCKAFINETSRLLEAKDITNGFWEVMTAPTPIKRVGTISYGLGCRELKTVTSGGIVS